MCCDTETAPTLASAIMHPVKAILTNCIFYGGSQKRAAAHRCRSFSGEVAVFMHGLFPFLPEGSTKSITQQVSVAPHGDGHGDILEEESAHYLRLLSPTGDLKWVFCRLGRPHAGGWVTMCYIFSKTNQRKKG